MARKLDWSKCAPDGGCAGPDMSEATLLNEYRAKPAKFHEGWDMHRRGFPFRSLVSIEAKDGWVARERFFPVENVTDE